MAKYIDPRNKVFAHLDRVIAWQRGEQPGPVSVEWDLSNRCTLGCQDCHFAHTHVKGPWASRNRLLPMAYDSTGDLADLAVVGRGLAQMAAADVKAVVWSGGGEPTTHPHWTEAIAMAATVGLEQGMYTLGGLLTPSSAAVLARHASWVVVSLDACDAETYARDKGVPAVRFRHALDGITALIGHKAVVGVSYLLHAENWRQVEPMLALARSLGASYTTFRPAIRTRPDQPSVCDDDRGWISEALNPDWLTVLQRVAQEPDVEIDLARFAAYRDWSGHGYTACEGPTLNTTITPDGRVWICPQRRGVSALGDLRKDSFAAIWARHPGRFPVDRDCRVMCRLHPVNEQLAAIRAPRVHEAFV